MQILLASNSPRRKELLSLTGWTYRVVTGEIDERPSQTESSREYVVRLAQEKAKAGAAYGVTGDLVIAADTAVVDQANGAELILGKPQDDLEANSMLQWLRGRVHQVYTGIAVYRIGDNSSLSDACCTAVPMREYSEREIRDYIATGDPLDKAGGYAIQHHGFHPVENFKGCYANVMGLPLCHLARLVASMGLYARVDMTSMCQETLQYQCTIYPKILSGDRLIG